MLRIPRVGGEPFLFQVAELTPYNTLTPCLYQEALKRQQSRAVRAQHARERAEEEIVLANLESEMNETAANRAACTALMGEAKLLLLASLLLVCFCSPALALLPRLAPPRS